MRTSRRNGYTTKEEHMPEKHLRYKETKGWDADYFLAQGIKIGINTQSVIARLLTRNQFPEQTYNTCLGVLSLVRKYGNDRLETACRLAMTVDSTSYQIVCNILKNNRDKEEEETKDEIFNLPSHENIRGKEAFK